MELGDHTLPDMGIVDAREMVQVIDRRLNGTVAKDDEELLATALGHETTESGAFRGKLAGLDKYGLLEGQGERELTPLAETLLDNEQRAVKQILSTYELYDQVREEFRDTLPTYAEWKKFLRDIGIKALEPPEVKKAWKQYIELARKLSPDSFGSGRVEISEDEFQATLDRLENEKTRKHALSALRDLASQPLPSADRFTDILQATREAEGTSDFEKLFGILRRAYYSSSEQLTNEQKEQVVDYALKWLEADDPDVRHDAWRLYKSLNTNLTREEARTLWEKAKTLLAEGIEEGDDEKTQDAHRIVRRFTDEWLVGHTEWIREMEEEVWADLEESDVSDELDDAYAFWLEQLREARGIR